MSLKSAHALSAASAATIRVVEFPHPDRLVQTARYQVIALRAERNRVDAILVALLAFSSFHEVAGLHIPDADTLIQTASRDEAVVWRHRHSGDAVFDLQIEDALVLDRGCLDVPDADRAVAGAGGDMASISGEVKRVDVLLVTVELIANDTLLDVPDLDGCSVSDGKTISQVRRCSP